MLQIFKKVDFEKISTWKWYIWNWESIDEMESIILNKEDQIFQISNVGQKSVAW